MKMILIFCEFKLDPIIIKYLTRLEKKNYNT